LTHLVHSAAISVLRPSNTVRLQHTTCSRAALE